MLTRVAGTSHEKGASCNTTLERTAVKGMGIAWVQAHEDEGTSHQLKSFPPIVYIFYQATWEGLNYNSRGKSSPSKEGKREGIRLA